MTTILARCGLCDAEVRLRPIDVELWVAEGTSVQMASYSFDCTECQERCTKDANEQIVRLLMSGGVVRHNRLARTSEPVMAGCLSHDFVLDAHLLLADDAAVWSELEGL